MNAYLIMKISLIFAFDVVVILTNLMLVLLIPRVLQSELEIPRKFSHKGSKDSQKENKNEN